MRTAAKPVLHRLLAMVGLCLILLAALPCAAAPVRPAMRQAMTADCAPCCKSAPVAANSLCCQAHPQPAQPVPSATSHEALGRTIRPDAHPGAPRLIQTADAVMPFEPAPPPPLHPVLRI